MPSPASLMSIRTPESLVCTAVTRTRDVGGEYCSALSISSASRCTESPAAAAITEQSGTIPVSTR